MKRRINYIALVLLLLVMSSTAFADAAPEPRRPKVLNSTDTAIKVVVDKNVRSAKLIVPKNIWQKMKAGIEGDDSLNAASRFNLSPMQTIMSGLLLSLAFVFAGVWFVRRKDANKNKVVIGIALFALCAACITTSSFANVPPPHVTTIKSNFLTEEAKKSGANGTITIEVVESSDQFMTMVLP